MFNSEGHRGIWLAAVTAGLLMVAGCSNQAPNQARVNPVAKKAAPAKPAGVKASTVTPAAKETAKEAPKEAKTGAKTEPKTHETTGTISAMSGTSLVLSHKRLKVKTTETTFVLNPKTKREGHLRIGAKVTVLYRVEKNQKIATSVKVREAKPATKPAAEKSET